ncbi:DUF397 domain-containing protein [Saccharomonospora piscinae]|uniref:DUF397 domain-containing protein n=1 Tax=Saccharomonospora piscinae TaxID=687388 RepID=A0A1V9A7B9_SACPI|nr:DUF397 domain-containing protein [Saccharomonospora piscinae]OQO92926.1 DUF397 domain-containing protein [Saccharomonospora piscinae]TLW93064.1 DUF397 domain-containing protein [Saccharomonospora piscinae]
MGDYAGNAEYDPATAVGLFDPGNWRKSYASEPNGGNCVEVNVAGDRIGVRDTKLSDSPVFVFRASEWDAFVRAVKAGQFDLPR